MMPLRYLALAACLIPALMSGGEARSSDLLVLSNEGKTLAIVDTVAAKVVRSKTLKQGSELATVSVNSTEREIWGVTKDLRLARLNLDTFVEISKSEVLETEAYKNKLLYCTDESVYCNLIISRKRVSALNEEGTIIQTADLPAASYRQDRPRIIGFGAVIDPNENASKLYAIDGDDNALIRLPPKQGAPKWKLVAKIEPPSAAPLTFDTVREDGATRGYVVLGSTLYSLNLKNGRLTKPRVIKGLKGEAITISFYAPAPAPDPRSKP